MSATPHQGGSAAPQASGRALVPFVAGSAAAASMPGVARPPRAILLVAVAGLAVGSCALAAYQARHSLSGLWFGRPDAAASAMHRLEDQVARLQGSVEALRVAAGPHDEDQWRGLKHSVETLKQDVEQVRTAGAATAAQLSAKIDRTDHDPLPKLTDIAARLDRIEHDSAPRTADGPTLAALAARLDRLEKQGAPAPHVASLAPQVAKPAAAPAAPVSAHAEVTKVPVTPVKTAALETPPPVAGWVLRDVYDGVALVEGRNGGLREVEPGEFLPGAGEIRSIERHGRAWVVLTSRGVIAAN